MTSREFVAALPFCTIFRNTGRDSILMRTDEGAVNLESGSAYRLEHFPNHELPHWAAGHPYELVQNYGFGEIIPPDLPPTPAEQEGALLDDLNDYLDDDLDDEWGDVDG